ncbi:MAG: glycosyltransferase family 2 protein [Bacteroidota bacterium]|nr:glycosyltransferase family 2 protein [Bacteroidota bacterium]
MTTAIVILNWNGERYLQQFLPVLIENTTQPDVEIIVADNASTDTSLAVLKDNFPSIRTIVLDKNYGFAGGYNKALAQVKADYYVLLNSDVEVTPGWLNPLIEYMNGHQEVAACQPKIRSYYQRTHFEHAGAAGGYIDRFGFPFCRGRILGVAEEDKGQYDSIADIFWATGACLLIRSGLYWQAGGLDDDFFAHMEEIDLCWRLKSRGYRIVCIPESTVYHLGGGTLNVENPYKTYLNFRNNLLMLYKNLPDKLLKKILFWRFVFDYAAAIQLFITGKPRNAMSVIKARRAYKQLQPGFEAKRKQNISCATTDCKSDILQQSIVLDYYLKGKKTFTALTGK